MNTEKIAMRIKELRLEKGLSQAKLGALLNVSQDTVSLWEKGKALPGVEYVILMCRIFEIPADYLLGITED